MKSFHNSEQGQAIVLIALAMVVLMGFTALAVDGSMAYSDRRYAQSASDSASLAGVTAAADVINQNNLTNSTWDCGSSAVQAAISAAKQAAISGAAANNQTIDANVSDNHGVSVTCVDTATEKYLDVEVQVKMESSPGFAGIVYKGNVVNQTTATSRVRPREALAAGFTIVALNKNACSGNKYGANFHGGPSLEVCGGGVFSNGCLIAPDKKKSVIVKDPKCTSVASEGIYYVLELVKGGGLEPAAQTASALDPETYTLDFTPQELCARSGANHVDGDDLPENLDPGLYCISGSIKGDLSGDGVTLVFLDGGLTCNGNCDYHLTAPKTSPDPYPAVPGLLIYSTYAGKYKLNGNNEMHLKGTILTPKADIFLAGTGDENSLQSQIICLNFESGGTNDSTYKWNEDVLFLRPIELELHR